jgi:hypothetical protein
MRLALPRARFSLPFVCTETRASIRLPPFSPSIPAPSTTIQPYKLRFSLKWQTKLANSNMAKNRKNKRDRADDQQDRRGASKVAKKNKK